MIVNRPTRPSRVSCMVLLHMVLWAGPATAAPTPPGWATHLTHLTHAVESQSPQEPEPLIAYVATSLSGPVYELVARWSARSGVSVTIDLDATSRLASRIQQAAPGDVFLSADPDWTAWLAQRERIEPGSTRILAGNRLVIAARTGSALSVARVEDLADPRIERLGLGGEAVPVGRYADQALRAAGVSEALARRTVRGASAKGVVEWVARGEVEAGVVYRTDALEDGRLMVLAEVPEALHAPIRYSASVLSTSPRSDLAADLVDFLGSANAGVEFTSRGFTFGEDVQIAGGTTSADLPFEVAGPSLWSAVRLSLVVAALATLLGLIPAVAVGWVLARKRFPGRTLVSTAVMIPLVIPPVVTGFLLLTVFGAESTLGGFLSGLGLRIPFTVLGAVVAAAVVGFPLYVVAIRSAFDAVDRRYEEVAATLGEPPRRSFIRVTLPLAAPGIAAGAILAFARGLGEFGATIVLAGNLEGRTRTIPLAVYSLIESPSGQWAIWGLVTASVGLCFVGLVGYEVLMRRLRRATETYHV